MPERNLITSIKIPPGLIEMIDADIEQNRDFRNRSEWIIAAIRAYQEYRIKLINDKKAAFQEEDDFISSSPRDLPADLRADNDDRN